MPSFEGVEHEVLMPDAEGEREGAIPYEELLESGDEGFEFPDLDENAAAAMCYTSGTTGRPKGVVYSHRSTVLHALCVNQVDAVGFSERDTLMPVVPMFHAMAWGMPYAAALGRRAPGAARAAHDPAGARRPDRLRARDAHRGRADDLAGHAPARPARPTSRACAR